MNFSMSSFILGKYTRVLVLRILFSMPWCGAWILFRISFLMVVGIDIPPLFSTKEFFTYSSSLNGQYGLSGVGVSMAFLAIQLIFVP